MKKKLIQFKNIVKEFDGKLVLKGVNLDIYENEFVTLLGPSGCGKTTLLRILGGFLTPNEGTVLFDGEDISKIPPYKREINTVFQKYALFPHMNVYNNIAFGLKIKKEPKDIIEQKVKRMLKLVNLEDFADKNVTEMSGGQQQRVAIARALVNEPSVLDDYKVMFEGRRFDCVDDGFEKNEVVDVVIRPEDLDIVPREQGKLKGVVKSVLFKGVHYETMVETKVGTEITVKMQVSNDQPVFNEAANEKMSANDYYLDVDDVEELDEATIIARADAQAWNPDEDELISIKEVKYNIKKENGTYPVTFSTAAGTSVTVNMIVKDENRVTSEENEEYIFAVNFFKKVDEIQESIALDTDLKTWANASAYSLEDDMPVEITDVKYDFDPENITPGIYDVTFATKGYEYKVDTTDKHEVGEEVGLIFEPEDIHIMSREQ